MSTSNQVETSTSIQDELTSTAQHLASVLPAEANRTIDDGIVAVESSGIAAQSLGAGDTAPDFTLPHATGGTVTLSTLLATGPVVLTFYRGEWCPYCNVQLRGYQRALSLCKKPRRGAQQRKSLDVAHAAILGIIHAVASQHIEKILYPRDREGDRCATPHCVFSEAV